MKDKLIDIKKQFDIKFNECSSKNMVIDCKALFLGTSSLINGLLKTLKNYSIEEKKILGPLIQEHKAAIEAALQDKLQFFELKAIEDELAQNWIDVSIKRSIKIDTPLIGGYHPVTLVQREIEDIFIRMGFQVLDGPHIEDDHHNFQALNIPEDHPARDMQDTFWFENQTHLLRTHTSTIQVRGMEQNKPPFRFIGPGKVFRCERTDASHEFVFHQLEGMMIDKNVSVGNLIYFMKALLKEIFQTDMEIRLRPGYFPFVEPGFELDIRCLICAGKGCSVCKRVGWLELLPCGMVHPRVLELNGIDSNIYSGFAFGLGLDRLVMMRYAINDIRLIHKGDLRFNQQFNFS